MVDTDACQSPVDLDDLLDEGRLSGAHTVPGSRSLQRSMLDRRERVREEEEVDQRRRASLEVEGTRFNDRRSLPRVAHRASVPFGIRRAPLSIRLQAWARGTSNGVRPQMTVDLFGFHHA